jgi:hypothetical protein
MLALILTMGFNGMGVCAGALAYKQKQPAQETKKRENFTRFGESSTLLRALAV